MKKGEHTEAEIIKAVKDTENGVSIEAVCRSHGIARGTLYKWRVKYGGMDVSQLKELKALQEENRRLKQMLRMPSERRDDLEKGSGKYSRLSGGRGITGATRDASDDTRGAKYHMVNKLCERRSGERT